VSEFHKSTNGRNNFFFSQSKLERGDSEWHTLSVPKEYM
jgi:hypothetical protein